MAQTPWLHLLNNESVQRTCFKLIESLVLSKKDEIYVSYKENL